MKDKVSNDKVSNDKEIVTIHDFSGNELSKHNTFISGKKVTNKSSKLKFGGMKNKI